MHLFPNFTIFSQVVSNDDNSSTNRCFVSITVYKEPDLTNNP